MRITESTVALSAKHEAERKQTNEITLDHSFRQVFESLASVKTDNRNELQERISQLLQSLIEAIMAAIDGKNAGKHCRQWPACRRSGALIARRGVR
jgi:hypothetical protein